MKKKWVSWVIIIAFAVALAHASIPHTHPEKADKHPHDHNDVNHKHHYDHSGNHSHSKPEKSEENLPVFHHFSNADYVGGPSFHFHAKEKHVLELLEPATLIVDIALVFDETQLFPRARDLPSARHRSSQSLRAPPLAS